MLQENAAVIKEANTLNNLNITIQNQFILLGKTISVLFSVLEH
jgi:hypothetical protein